MPINPNARTENISFREGATWMWNFLHSEPSLSEIASWQKVKKAMEDEANRRYPDFDPLPLPTSAPKGGMEL